MIELLSSSNNCINEFGPVLDDIAIFARNVEFIFNFVPCECNRVAHGLARNA